MFEKYRPYSRAELYVLQFAMYRSTYRPRWPSGSLPSLISVRDKRAQSTVLSALNEDRFCAVRVYQFSDPKRSDTVVLGKNSFGEWEELEDTRSETETEVLRRVRRRIDKGLPVNFFEGVLSMFGLALTVIGVLAIEKHGNTGILVLGFGLLLVLVAAVEFFGERTSLRRALHAMRKL